MSNWYVFVNAKLPWARVMTDAIQMFIVIITVHAAHFDNEHYCFEYFSYLRLLGMRQHLNILVI